MSEIAQPQDHQQADELFTYTTPAGKPVTLKPYKRMPAGVFRKAKSMDEIEATFALLEAATDAAGLEAVDEMEIGDLEDLFEKWVAMEGIDLPKS